MASSNSQQSNAMERTGQQMREQGREIRDAVQDAASGIKEKAHEKLEGLRSSAHERIDDVREEGQYRMMQLEEYVQTEPLKAVLYATGFGFLLGLILLRR